MNELSKDTLSTIKVARLGNSDNVKAGQMVIAIGNALGYGQSVTVGYISALDREVTVDDVTMDLIQTDAAINPGNSGGALINTSGEVVGMNSVKYASADVEGMGYAIPISDAIPMIEQLMNREVVAESEQGYLGINLQTAQDITDTFSQQFKMPLGVYVNEVLKGSPAEKAGLKAGNIIVGVNGVTVETAEDLVNAITYCKAGETVTVKVSVLNNGTYEEKDLSVVLGKRPKE
jgi:serine protease Do